MNDKTRKHHHKRDDRQEYPETYEKILSFTRSIGLPDDVACKYRYAKPEFAQKIIGTLRYKINNKVISNKLRLLEIQRYRCAYDDHLMVLDDKRHPRFATVEHLKKKADGGIISYDNIVVVCMICNSMRDHLGLSPEAFYEWAQANKSVLVERERSLLDRWEKRKARRAQ